MELLDKLISIGLKEIPKVQNDYNDLFIDNENSFGLWPKMGLPFDEKVMESLSNNTWLFKGTYKKTFPETSLGKPTFFAMWLSGKLNSFRN